MKRALTLAGASFGSALILAAGAVAGQDAYPTFVTKFDRAGPEKFAGKVKSTKGNCEDGRQVVVYRKHDGEKKRMGSDRTSGRGRFLVKLGHRPRDGRYFAKAEKAIFRANSGKRRTCRPGRSAQIDVG
jgi:hypothetical protein